MTECLIEIVNHASPAAAARIVAEEAATWIAMCAMEAASTVVLPGGRSQIAMLADLARSEEHTSELQSLILSSYADVCMKKKNSIMPNSSSDSLLQKEKPTP